MFCAYNDTCTKLLASSPKSDVLYPGIFQIFSQKLINHSFKPDLKLPIYFSILRMF